MCGAGVMTSSPGGVSSQPATSTTDKPSGESRKVRKPLMEKRRRARINQSLNELKRMLVDSDASGVKEGSKASKLEKADILELTVQRLQRLHREHEALKERLQDGGGGGGEQRRKAAAAAANEAEGRRFRAGYRECAREAARLLGAAEADPSLRERLSRHLAARLGHLERRRPGAAGTAVLRPTRLPNGDLAFVIPVRPPTDIAARRVEDHSEPVWRPW